MVSNVNVKLVILGFLGFFNSGSILQGQLYTAMPGQSGTVMTLNNVSGLVGGFMLALGFVAQQYGLQYLCGYLQPRSLLIGLFKV